MDFVEESARSDAFEHDIWIPLTGIDVEECFRIGNVTLQPIHAEQVARWDMAHRAAVTSAEQPQVLPDHFKAQWQGKTAASITVLGDDDYAAQVAMEETERTCAMLRLLEPENRSATSLSSLHPEGRPATDSNTFLSVVRGRPDREIRSTIDTPTSLRITRQMLPTAWKSGGMQEIDKLLRQDPGTTFQQRLLQSALIYSEQRLTRDPVEKLIFALVALETLLLKDQHEPIRYKLGERLALALGATASDRQRIISVVFKAYELRSRYLHHGHKRDDLDAVAAMLELAWEFLLRLLRRQDQFSSPDDLVQQLDLARLSGPCVLPLATSAQT